MEQKTSEQSKSKIIPCIICNKESIYNMSCRCNQWTCKRHRDPAKHNCSFNFTQHCLETIKTNNPKIESEKISAI